jgi:hypothetical protein
MQVLNSETGLREFGQFEVSAKNGKLKLGGKRVPISELKSLLREIIERVEEFKSIAAELLKPAAQVSCEKRKPLNSARLHGNSFTIGRSQRGQL